MDPVSDSHLVYFQKSLPEDLPLELFEKILSSLNKQEYQRASLVNHNWNGRVIDLTERQLINKAAKEIKLLISLLGSETAQSKSLMSLLGTLSNHKGTGLIDNESFIRKTDEAVYNILKTLSDECLNDLKAKYDSHYFIIQAAEIYKKIDLASGLNNEKTLTNLSIELTKHGLIEKAINLAQTLSETPQDFYKNGRSFTSTSRAEALHTISLILLAKNVPQAVKAASFISDTYQRRSKTIAQMATILLNVDEIAAAEEVVRNIPEKRLLKEIEQEILRKKIRLT